MKASALLSLTLKTFVALTVVTVLALSAFVGLNAEVEFHHAELDAIKEASLPIKVKSIYFHHGWFSSDARSEYTMMIGRETVHLDVDHHINHFVIPLVRWAKTNHEITRLDFGNTNIPIPDNLNFSTEKLFFGGSTTQFSAKEISLDNDGTMKLSMKNPYFSMTVSPDGARQFDASVASINLAGATGGADLKLVNLQFAGSSANNTAAETGWRQQGLVKLELIEIAAANKLIFALHGLSMDTELKDRGANIDVVYQTRIQSSQFGNDAGMMASDINLNFSFLNLKKSALLQLRAALKEQNANQNDAMAASDNPLEQQRLLKQQMQLILKHSSQLITNSPAFNFSRFSMTTPFGDVDGKMEVHVNGDNFNPNEVTEANFWEITKARTYGVASLRMARNVLMHTAESADQSQNQLKESMLKAYTDQGYIVDDGKTISVNASFGPQGVDLNGKHVM